ncbi:MAG: NADP-dependent malic enzyme [Micavibrio sp.]|nr:NADP-dependent malic enzyme [Micavibrio sp.]
MTDISDNYSNKKKDLTEAALEYHLKPRPGKLSLLPTKPLTTQRDLSLAYSPGVAIPCLEIEKDPLKALDYTSRGNLVAVISNGTAVLGLGNIGALASKPVMEGKCCLFKKFADIDSIDIEVDETDVDKLVDTIAALEPSFGGINLEDIKAPECFEVERRLRERMNIPVFHDDQHGTAIIVAAAFMNWIHLTGRDIKKTKLVGSGAGASAIACLRLLVEAGLPRENITICDREGVVYKGRNTGMDPAKEEFASDTKDRTLGDAIKSANVFLGLSGPGVLDQDMVKSMADAPLIMALANPTPEIMPELAKEVKPNAVICTGRSDYTNQVNNVLCFPFIFRGALDVGATTINEEMKLACVHAIAKLARKEATAEVASLYSDEILDFGSDYLIPKPFDPRLIVDVSAAAAQAAMDTGVAARPIKDMAAYKEKLHQFFYRTDLVMRPVFNRAKANPQRIVYCEGEEEKVLRASQVTVDDGNAFPILIGRKSVVETRIKRLNLRLQAGKDFEIVDPEDDPRYKDYWTTYHQIMERRGVTPSDARRVVRTNTTVIGALMVYKGEADAVICGTEGQYSNHLKHVNDIIGLKDDVRTASALSVLIHPKGPLFICDTHVNPHPCKSQIVEMTLLAIEEIKRFGITPKVALLSHSNFGTSNTETSAILREACSELKKRAPDIEIDGEMQADVALSSKVRDIIMPNSTLSGEANLLVMPSMDAANISFNMLKTMSDGVSIGPLLLGCAKPAYILTPSVTPRGIVNVSALATVAAQVYEVENEKEIFSQQAV